MVSTLYLVAAGNVLIHSLYTYSDDAFTNDAQSRVQIQCYKLKVRPPPLPLFLPPIPIFALLTSIHSHSTTPRPHSAAANGNVGLVKCALSHGQPINSVLDGVLPLHVASAGGNNLVVRLLIEQGVDVNASR